MHRRSPHRALLVLIAFIAAQFVTIVAPASGNPAGKAWSEDSRSFSEGWPWPKLPNWWNRSEKWFSSQAFTDVRLGQWLPCRLEWSMNDCIKEINVYDSDGKSLGSLTYIQEPGFDPFELPQSWTQTTDPSSQTVVDHFPDFANKNGVWTKGWWRLPPGLTLSNGDNLVNANAVRMLAALQINISPKGLDEGVSLPVGITFETVLMSKNLKNRARWITSSGKDPSVVFESEGRVRVRGVTSKFPNPGGKTPCSSLPAGNQEKSVASAAFMAVNISTASVYDSAQYISSPGEVVLGTNGWWCLGGITWDPKERQISVQVGAPHYFEDGVTEVDGWLELKLRGELVKHWWGIAPEEATGYARVELSYKDGSTKLATVSAKYFKEQDWIDLRAYGFTYSNPVLRISLQRPKTEVIVPVKAVSKKSKKSTITCVRGKTIKKISATKCPKGYVKK